MAQLGKCLLYRHEDPESQNLVGKAGVVPCAYSPIAERWRLEDLWAVLTCSASLFQNFRPVRDPVSEQGDCCS